MRNLFVLALLVAAAFAGCTTPPIDDLPPDDGTRPRDGEDFAPQEGHQEASTDTLSLVGDLSVECADDSMFCIDAVATNEGGDAIYVHNICITSWSESMKQRDSTVQKTEPMAYCEAFGLRAMETNEQMEQTFSWDGRLWDDDAQEYRDAPEDSYTWSIHFQYYENQEGGESHTVTIEFPVIIGET